MASIAMMIHQLHVKRKNTNVYFIQIDAKLVCKIGNYASSVKIGDYHSTH